MSEELVIHENRIEEAAGRGNSDSRLTSFKVIIPLKFPINYVSPIVRCIVLPLLLIRDNE